MNRVFILFGAPGGGKSLSCELLENLSDYSAVTIQKESTRLKRNSDNKEIKIVDKISNDCDIRYSQYGNDYGFSSKDIWNILKQKKSAIIIVNDIRTIRILNKKFGNLTHSIYIHSNIDRHKIFKISKQRYPDKSDDFLSADVSRRIEKIKTVHRKYIENTALFQSAIINIYEINNSQSQLLLEQQLQQIYKKVPVCKISYSSTSRVFVIAGASFSGKDQLVNAMIQLDPDKVSLYQKASTRPKKADDKGELKHVKTISKKHNIIYSNNGYEYAICSQDIWGCLSKEKVALIVLSDLEAIKQIKDEFSSICSVVYLHANVEPEALDKAQKELSNKEYQKRIDSTEKLLNDYIHNINLFDHVLLNTSESEDLYDQAFNILDYYLD
jgi:guanylate kinase